MQQWAVNSDQCSQSNMPKLRPALNYYFCNMLNFLFAAQSCFRYSKLHATPYYMLQHAMYVTCMLHLCYIYVTFMLHLCYMSIVTGISLCCCHVTLHVNRHFAQLLTCNCYMAIVFTIFIGTINDSIHRTCTCLIKIRKQQRSYNM